MGLVAGSALGWAVRVVLVAQQQAQVQAVPAQVSLDEVTLAYRPAQQPGGHSLVERQQA